MEDSKKHHYDIKEDDCKTSSKEVIQDRIHVGEMGGCQIDTEKLQLEVRSIVNLYHIILQSQQL